MKRIHPAANHARASPLPPSSQVVVAVVPMRRLDRPLHIRLLLLLLLHEVGLGRHHPGTPPPPPLLLPLLLPEVGSLAAPHTLVC